MTYTHRRIGLALGSGAARGISHIGIIRELETMGIRPDIVCGTSIGAVVGAYYVSGKLDALEEWVCSLSQWDIVKIMNFSLLARGGFTEGENLIGFFEKHLGSVNIEDLAKPFAAIATDMTTGQEIWFKEGPLIEAIRASISLPVIMTPVQRENQFLLDGGLVNPVPVSVCRALGAQVVIAVNLNGELVGKHFTPVKKKEPGTEENETVHSSLWDRLTQNFRELSDSDKPSMFEVLASFIDIMEDRITRSRMAGDPPDAMLIPILGHISLLEFDRAQEAIECGRRCVQRSRLYLEDVLGISIDAEEQSQE